MPALPMNQIAINVSDLQHSQRWYRDIFGYQESGGTYMFIPILGSADVQGVPDATSECWWLMDQQDFFQLELFEFSKPTPKPLPADWRPCDIGYTTIGIHVRDFDATLTRLARRQVALLTDPIGEPGSRRVCVRDPDGVLLEIMDDDPRSAEHRSRPYDVPVATRFATLSVPDLEQARRTWIEVFGLSEEPDVVLHTPEHEALWGLAGASRESFLLRAGDMFIEVVQYLDPVGKPWPEGYRITDHGLLNIALGLRSEDEHDQLVQRCIEAGIHPNSTKPTPLKKLWYAVYVNDPMGFSVELLYHSRAGQSLPVFQVSDWLNYALRADYRAAIDKRLRAYLFEQGRIALTKPLYQEMIKTPSGIVLARSLLNETRPFLHPIMVWEIETNVFEKAGIPL